MQEAPRETLEFHRQAIEIKSYVGVLVQSFEQKAA